MSDTVCPKCEAALQRSIYGRFECDSILEPFYQSDRCRIRELSLTIAHQDTVRRELEAELAKWKPLTNEEAERAYAEAEAVPVSKEEHDRIVKAMLDPTYHPSNTERAVLTVKRVRELEAESAQLKEDWLTEQRARLDQNSFVEMYGAARAKVRIEELEAEVTRLRADKERLLEAWKAVREQPNVTLGQKLLIDAAMKGADR